MDLLATFQMIKEAIAVRSYKMIIDSKIEIKKMWSKMENLYCLYF